MELDELKNRWISLEEQLKKQNILNEKMLQEIRQSKSGPLNQLINYTYFGTITCALGVPLLIYGYTLNYFAAFKTSLFIFAGLILIVCTIINIYNILHLKKIDLTENVSRNIQLLQTYKINIKKQFIPVYIAIIILIIMSIIACFLSPHMETWRWFAIGAIIIIGVIIAYLEYKKIFKAKTNDILKSLNELKELEEDI